MPHRDINVIELEELMAAAAVAYDEVMPLVRKVLQREGVSIMGRSKNDDLSDILGDTDTPATKAKGAVMKKQDKEAKSKTPAKAAAPVKGKAAALAKAKPAKPTKASGNGAARGTRGEGKFYFPADSKEFQALKSKMATLKKAVSTKDLAAALKTDTWKVRLVSVALEGEKKLKREKVGNVLMLKPR